jgi:Ras-related protein Rab-1A
MEDRLIFKLLLIGDSGVGKSSLLSRFADEIFEEDYTSTIGVDFRSRDVVIDGKRVTLQLWDTAGQERFRSITQAYYRNADGIIIVYDVSDPDSFDHVEDWLDDIAEANNHSASKLLVGNKADRIYADSKALNPLGDPNKEALKIYQKGHQLAEKLKIPFLETSAKTSTNVDATFLTVAKQILDHQERLRERLRQRVPDQKPKVSIVAIEPLTTKRVLKCCS